MTAAARAWILVALLWVVGLLNYLDRQIIFALFPLLERDLRLSPVELGLLGTSFLWVYGIASPFAGYLADRFGRARVIVVSLALWSAVTWATGRARGLPDLLVARGLMGVSEACYFPAALALIADRHSGRTRSLATGLHASGVYAGIALGGGLGGALGALYGWRFPFALLGAAGLVYLLVVTPGLRLVTAAAPAPAPPTGAEDARAPSRLVSTLQELASLPGFPRLVAVFAATSLANWMVYTWLPLYLYERFNLPLAEAGLTATLYIQVGGVAGIVAGGLAADRWSERSARGRVYAQAAGIALAAPFLALVGLAPSKMLLIAALLAFGFGKGVYECSAMPVLCQIARPDVRATGYGVFNCAGCIAGGLAAPLAGSVKSSLGLGGALAVAGGVLAVAAVALLRLRLPDVTALSPRTAAAAPAKI